MHRRTFIAASVASIAMARPGQAKASLGAISAYLNQITTAQSKFTQITDTGEITTGQIYIRRPGRVRFDYDPPEETLVMAGGGQVAIFDGKSNRVSPEQYPLRRTPLNLILEANVDLSRRNMVVGHRGDGPKTIVTAQDPEHPEYGRIEMVFTDNPVQLRQWVIVDGNGRRTTVILADLVRGGNFPPSYFNIPTEVNRRGG